MQYRLRPLFLLLAMLASCAVRAQGDGVFPLSSARVDTTFFDLPAQEYTVAGGELPWFTAQVALPQGSGRAPRVWIEYPELQRLRGDQARALRAAGASVGREVQSSASYGVSRGQALVDVAVCPFVRRGGRYYRVTSFKLCVERTRPEVARLEAARAQQVCTARWAAHSVLAQGRWVRISVEREGIYRLTPERLREMGFTDPARVKVYGYGGQLLPENFDFDSAEAVPDDLCEVPLCRDGAALLFWAEGTARYTWNAAQQTFDYLPNHYARRSSYFVTEGNAPASVPLAAAPATPAGTPLQAAPAYTVVDKDEIAFYPGGRELYELYDFADGSTRRYTLSLPGIVAGSQATMAVALAARRNQGKAQVAVSVNGTAGAQFAISARNSLIGVNPTAYEGRYRFNTSACTASTDLSVTVTPAGTEGHFNHVVATYQRSLTADASYAFVQPRAGAVAFAISGASEKMQVWQLSPYGQPRRIATTAGAGALIAATESPVAGTRYVVVDPARAYPEPQVEGEVAQQDLHGGEAVQYLIVVPSSGKLTAQAERLAAWHRQHSGLRTKVVTAQQVYNEFSSGTPDATALRRYLKMHYDRAAGSAELMPRYLLLFGASAWDNRMLSSDWKKASPDDYLLAFEGGEERSTGNPAYREFPVGELYSFVTDDYYSWLDDGEGTRYATNKPDLGVGRMACADEATAQTYVDKTIAYMQGDAAGAWRNRIIVLGDDEDRNLHMQDAEALVSALRAQRGDRIDVHQVYWDAYPRVSTPSGVSFPQASERLRKYMREGALMFNYTGHGAPGQIAKEGLLFPRDFQLPSQGRLPLWTMASCEISPFDQAITDLARTAMENPEGGAVAVMCAARSVYSNYNKAINLRFSRLALSEQSDGTPLTLGDALCQAKAGLITGQGSGGMDVTNNKLMYALHGDPALRLGYARGRVVIDRINGEALTPDARYTLPAGSVASFGGYVADGSGAPAPFEGVVTASVFDREERVTCHNYSGATQPMTYTDRTKLLFQGSDSVRAGRFEITMRVPRDISYSEAAGRVSLYAISRDHQTEASGSCEQLCFNGTSPALDGDNTPPEVFVYLDSPDFTDGAVCSRTPLFGARISDDSGINVSGLSVGHDLELCIDGDLAQTYTLNEAFAYDFGSFASGELTYQLGELAPGRHTLSFTAWDVNNNRAQRNLTFYVGSQGQQDFGLHVTENPARTQTAFVTRLTGAQQDGAVRTDVYDCLGRLVWSAQGHASGTATYVQQWALCTTGGAPVAPGLYIVRATVTTAQGTYETAAQRVVVTR